MESALAGVRLRFLNELVPRSLELRRLQEQISENVNCTGSTIDVGILAHKLAGTAATLGFRELGEAAADLDELIAQHPGSETIRCDLLKKIDKLLRLMQDAMRL